MIQTHQTSTINIGEAYIQDYIHCFFQTELWYGRAFEFLRACIAKELYIYTIRPPLALVAGQHTVSMSSGFTSLRIYLYPSQESRDIKDPFARGGYDFDRGVSIIRTRTISKLMRKQMARRTKSLP